MGGDQKELDDIEKAIKEEDIGSQMAFDGIPVLPQDKINFALLQRIDSLRYFS